MFFSKQGSYASPGFSQAWKASSLPVQDAGAPHAAVGGQEQAVTNSKDLKAGQKKPHPLLVLPSLPVLPAAYKPHRSLPGTF